MENRYSIETPEQIAFDYAIAGIGSRFLAAIVDSLLIIAAQLLIGIVVGLAIMNLNIGESILQAGAAILGFVLLWGYYLAFELTWNGQTPGKRLVGLRVVREGGRPITATASIIRNLLRVVDFLPFLYGIGVVVMFIDPRARRLGDLAAGVLVVRERSEVTLESLMRPVQPQTILAEPVVALAGQLSERDYAIVESFLNQRQSLSRSRRMHLATLLIEQLTQRLGPLPAQPPEQVLEALAASFRAERASAPTA